MRSYIRRELLYVLFRFFLYCKTFVCNVLYNFHHLHVQEIYVWVLRIIDFLLMDIHTFLNISSMSFFMSFDNYWFSFHGHAYFFKYFFNVIFICMSFDNHWFSSHGHSYFFKYFFNVIFYMYEFWWLLIFFSWTFILF